MRQKTFRGATGPSEPRAPLLGEGILIGDATGRPIAIDRGAQAILQDLCARGDESNGRTGRIDNHGELPQPIRDLLNARDEDALEAGLLRVNAGKREYTCRAFILHSFDGMPVQTMVAIYLKRELSVADAVRQVSAEYHLTDREQEALIGVSMGLTSKELAQRMKISPNTVKAFLRLIMVKMGTTTRAGIVGKLLDQNSRLSDGRTVDA